MRINIAFVAYLESVFFFFVNRILHSRKPSDPFYCVTDSRYGYVLSINLHTWSTQTFFTQCLPVFASQRCLFQGACFLIELFLSATPYCSLLNRIVLYI